MENIGVILVISKSDGKVRLAVSFKRLHHGWGHGIRYLQALKPTGLCLLEHIWVIWSTALIQRGSIGPIYLQDIWSSLLLLSQLIWRCDSSHHLPQKPPWCMFTHNCAFSGCLSAFCSTIFRYINNHITL